MATIHFRQRLAVPVAIAVAAITLSGCKGDVLDYRNAQIVNGKVYAGDANTPFSGKVTNVPASNILNNQQGYQRMMQNSAYVVPEAYRDGINSMMIHSLLCDARVSDGMLAGDVACKAAQSDTVRMKMSFSDAALTGPMQIFDSSGDRTVLDVSFSNGKPDGTEKIYYAPTKQLIGEFPWKHGWLDGTVKTYDGKTGNESSNMLRISIDKFSFIDVLTTVRHSALFFIMLSFPSKLSSRRKPQAYSVPSTCRDIKVPSIEKLLYPAIEPVNPYGRTLLRAVNCARSIYRLWSSD
ncbi:hypothetical protein WJ25_06635 [Burkholderia thailandensis]|nr:hypothetical protein [Burkholderia thailandensis]KVG12476.1 hypothetical protein WJ25_06635 [Burkholderia thailandensis]